MEDIKKLTLGEGAVYIKDIVDVSRYKRKVYFDDKYKNRVKKNRELVNILAKSEEKLYGITTGLGDNCTEIISLDERKICQANTIRSHATSLGKPYEEEVVRAIMIVMLVHLGNGHSGIRLETLEMIRTFLNKDIIPVVPEHGSVGYLSLEAHVALSLMGEGFVFYKGEKQSTATCLKKLGIKPIEVFEKEGLSLTSGTTSITALSSLAIYDSQVIAKSADVIAAMTLETLGANMMAFDKRLHDVRKHKHQQETAKNIRSLLKNSEIIKSKSEKKIQDSLSLRAISQSHGASKLILSVAEKTAHDELASSVDNPLIFEKDKEPDVVMGCNADGSYLGMLSDSCCIAITGLAKISERRTNRLISKDLSGLPAFLMKNPGLNNGLMIPQYSSVGILGEMRILSHPATIDNGTMSAMQEDYVSMGYNAAAKFYKCTKLARYVLATELLYSLQAYGILEEDKFLPAKNLLKTYKRLRKKVPYFENDAFFVPYIEDLSDDIKEGNLIP